MSKSTRLGREDKPVKPYAVFPLLPHATKRWPKKNRGKLHYFRPWEDPAGALKKYLEQRDDLHTGRKPRLTGDQGTVRDLANHFLNHKRHFADTREITERTFTEYHSTCELLVTTLGRDLPVTDLRAEDFADLRATLAKKWGPVTLGNAMQRIGSVFRHADNAGLIDRRVQFGPGFARPSMMTLHLERAKNVPRSLRPRRCGRSLRRLASPSRQ
jgi:hypothetical protein